jgi:hypothetical protein
MIQAHREALAIRRALLLLERSRQDGIGPLSDIKDLEGRLDALQNTVAAGRPVGDETLTQLEKPIASLEHSVWQTGRRGVAGILLKDAVEESREILERMRH